ncbi:MAG: hypothetical protein PSX81_02960 [bacterium]|nr:hypothetical protein [bacterium]
MSKIKIGIAGNSDSVNQYLPFINAQNHYKFVGVFDSTKSENFETFYGLNPFVDFVKRTDAVLFCGSLHLNLTENIISCIKLSKHIILEKFNQLDYYELLTIQKLLKEAGSLFYYSNVSGTQSVYTTARQLINNPGNISAKVHLPYVKTFSEIEKFNILAESVDMVIRSVSSPIAKIKVNRHYIFNQQPDELKVHLLFDNGTVADIVYNLFSKNAINYFTAYQKGKIITADFDLNKVEETRVDMMMENQLSLYNDTNSNLTIANKMQVFEKKVLYFDALQKDLLNFADCITNHVSPLVGIEEAINVAHVLQQIQYTRHESIV